MERRRKCAREKYQFSTELFCGKALLSLQHPNGGFILNKTEVKLVLPSDMCQFCNELSICSLLSIRLLSENISVIEKDNLPSVGANQLTSSCAGVNFIVVVVVFAVVVAVVVVFVNFEQSLKLSSVQKRTEFA